WDEKRQQWNISGQIYKTRNITQTAIGDKQGRWTTVFAAAVLLL
ncbi:MAG: pyruvoyl-dependent arginine decarboxylase, partial [Thermoproteota archaeon]